MLEMTMSHAATTRVEGSLKICVVVGGLNLGSRTPRHRKMALTVLAAAVRNGEQMVLSGDQRGGADVEAEPGSIASNEVVTVTVVWWLETRRQWPSGDDASGRISK